jgi:hypothetical protein
MIHALVWKALTDVSQGQNPVSCQQAGRCMPWCHGLQELPDVWLVNVYTPNSGDGLKRLDYRIQQWDKALAGYVKVGWCCAVGGLQQATQCWEYSASNTMLGVQLMRSKIWQSAPFTRFAVHCAV